MPNTRADYTAFVPNGDSRQETAALLVTLADEHGIDQRSIRATSGGFDVTDELADLLYEEPAEEVTETPDKAPAKTAKKNKE